jgi:hypothetical protein
MAVDDPLVLALQHVIIASAQSQGRPVLLGEVASAMAGLIVDPPLTPFFQADQDGVNIRELLSAAIRGPWRGVRS